MSVFPVCLFFLLLSSFPRADGLSADDQKKIDLGLTVAKEVAGLLENKQFTKSLTKIATNIGPYLGALGPFVGLVMAFIPVPDPVMEQLKKMMENIDNRFDKVDNRFNDIERQIDWAVVKINFGQIEQNILAMSRKYEHIYKVPKAGAAAASQNFISNYGPVFQHASTKLFQAITQKHGNFQEDIATSVMRYTKNDRRETQTFLLGVMKLMLQAVKIELSYYALQKQDTLGTYMKGVWEKQIQDVRKNFEAADRTVVSRYHTQLGSDIKEYSTNNKGQSNKDFAKGLWTVLNSKYYWRNWIVIAYKPIGGWDNHCVRSCGGYIKFRTDGRNFIVASRDNGYKIMDLARAERSMKGVAMKKRVGNWFSGYRNVRREAREVFNSLDKNGACSVGVIRCNNDIWLYFHTKRVKYVNRCKEFGNFYMWMWG